MASVYDVLFCMPEYAGALPDRSGPCHAHTIRFSRVDLMFSTRHTIRCRLAGAPDRVLGRKEAVSPGDPDCVRRGELPLRSSNSDVALRELCT